MIPRPKRVPRLWCALQGLLPWESNGHTPAHFGLRLTPRTVADPFRGGGQNHAAAAAPTVEAGSHGETSAPRRG